MLFSDGPFLSANDLQIIDGEFNKVAASESIITDTSSQSVIIRSLSELGNEFISKIQNFSGYLVGIGVGSNHQAAVMNILSTAINRPRVVLHQIPVSEPDPTRLSFKRWAEYYCLHDFYRSAWRRGIGKVSRYEAKMEHYAEERKRSWEILKSNGFPIVMNPLAAPGASLVYGSGVWGAGNVSVFPGGTQVGTVTYNVAVTWCNLPSYVSTANQGGAESAGSAIIAQSVAAAHVLKADITGLTPPDGTMPVAIGTASGIYPPQKATHWNVYVGGATGLLFLQNPSPIPVATKTYTLADAPVLNGFPLNAGQPGQFDFAFQNVVWRS